jgi:hypothetical protein
MIPAGKHTDWPFPLSLIPRSWTAIASDKAPWGFSLLLVRPKDADKTTAHLDVPMRNEAVLDFSRYGFMFSVNAKGWLFRVGSFRYDYVDKYYELPTLTLKRHS